MMIVYTMLES